MLYFFSSICWPWLSFSTDALFVLFVLLWLLSVHQWHFICSSLCWPWLLSVLYQWCFICSSLYLYAVIECPSPPMLYLFVYLFPRIIECSPLTFYFFLSLCLLRLLSVLHYWRFICSSLYLLTLVMSFATDTLFVHFFVDFFCLPFAIDALFVHFVYRDSWVSSTSDALFVRLFIYPIECTSPQTLSLYLCLTLLSGLRHIDALFVFVCILCLYLFPCSDYYMLPWAWFYDLWI